MFCNIFSATTYISDQVTRNICAASQVSYQKNSLYKHPEDMQVQRQVTGSAQSWGIQEQSANGEVKTHCQLLSLKKFPSQQLYKKTPFYKEQLAATCILRKLLSYWITQCFIYVMCHHCKKNWYLSSFALLGFYGELLTTAKHSLGHCFKLKVMKEALRLPTNFLCTGVCVKSTRTLC